MAQADTAQEKTEQATPKRLDDAKKKGQVPRSRELNTFLSLIAASLGVMVFGAGIMNDLTELLRGSLNFGRSAAFNDRSMVAFFSSTALDGVLLLAPLFSLMFISVFIGPIGLGGWTFSPGSLAPKAERINPLKGLARIFSSKGLIELTKALAKFAVVATAATFIILAVIDDLLGLALVPPLQSMTEIGGIFIWCFIAFSSTLVLIAMIDVPFQLWDHSRQLKMTKQEIKDESKETDGRPEVKARIRNLQQQAAQARMMEEVPTADVVITNPTHYAVALRYVDGDTAAPIVVAKGKDLIAARIREIAREHGITIFSAPPLARALHATTDINQEIPGNLFVAVAQVLAYVFQLRTVDVQHKDQLAPPQDLPVPDEYQQGEQ